MNKATQVTETLRRGYVRTYVWANPDQADVDFKELIAELKAEIWDEGFDAGHYVEDWESRGCDCRKNPYREEK